MVHWLGCQQLCAEGDTGRNGHKCYIPLRPDHCHGTMYDNEPGIEDGRLGVGAP